MTTPATRTPLPPKPDTIRAYLISAGYQSPTYTKHHYFETRRVRLKGPSGNGSDVWEFLYKCFKTGATRRWGICNIDGKIPADEPDPETDDTLDAPDVVDQAGN